MPVYIRHTLVCRFCCLVDRSPLLLPRLLLTAISRVGHHRQHLSISQSESEADDRNPHPCVNL